MIEVIIGKWSHEYDLFSPILNDLFTKVMMVEKAKFEVIRTKTDNHIVYSVNFETESEAVQFKLTYL